MREPIHGLGLDLVLASAHTFVSVFLSPSYGMSCIFMAGFALSKTERPKIRSELSSRRC